MSIEAMKLALEALWWTDEWRPQGLKERAITALRTAIAEAEKQEPLGYWNAVDGWVELPEEAQKPVAWVYPEALEAFQQGKPWTAYGEDGSGPNPDGVERIPLYTTPPAAQRQWVGLTDEEAMQTWGLVVKYAPSEVRLKSFARLIRDKLKEKNHG